PFVCLLALQAAHAQIDPLATTTLQQEKANDTPACTATYAPPYCYASGADEPPLSTASANEQDGAQTIVVDATGHLAPSPYSHIGSLMPDVSGQAWAGKVICEYQPWFSANPQTSFGGNVGPYNGHKDIGYDEDADDSNNQFNSSASTQNTAMINRGCNIDLIDFYGFIEPSQDFNQDTTTNGVYADLASRGTDGSYPMQFAVMEDKGISGRLQRLG
ncbi:MAG: hypothetical protein WA824_06555, partial [Candidatus Sulfotelmatobacter sp.]